MGQDEIIFLDVTQTLWDVNSTAGVKPKGKNSYSFTLSLPGDASIAEKPSAPRLQYRLPPSFSERASNSYIDYKVVVTIRRSMLKVNKTSVISRSPQEGV